MHKKIVSLVVAAVTMFSLAAPAQALYSNAQQSIPAGLLFKYENSPTVYFMVGTGPEGCKRGFSSYQMFKNWTGVNPHIVLVSPTLSVGDCGGGTGNVINTPQLGTVYQKAGQEGIYIYTGNGPYRFPSMEDFNAKGYKASQIETFITEQAGWGENQIWTRPDGTVFKYPNDSTVYLLSGNQKMPFTSIQLYDTQYSSRNYIMIIPTSETYPTGGFVNYFGSGYVLKGSGPQVYLSSGNQLRPMSNYQVFLDLGYTPQDIIKVDDSELARQPLGAMLN